MKVETFTTIVRGFRQVIRFGLVSATVSVILAAMWWIWTISSYPPVPDQRGEAFLVLLVCLLFSSAIGFLIGLGAWAVFKTVQFATQKT